MEALIQADKKKGEIVRERMRKFDNAVAELNSKRMLPRQPGLLERAYDYATIPLVDAALYVAAGQNPLAKYFPCLKK